MRAPIILAAPIAVTICLSGCEPLCDDKCKADKWRIEAAEQKATFEASRPPPAQGISLAEFNRLQIGMTYQQAVDVIGLDGTVISESQVVGFKTVMLMWNGEAGTGANANLIFQNGKLIQKAQFGLE